MRNFQNGFPSKKSLIFALGALHIFIKNIAFMSPLLVSVLVKLNWEASNYPCITIAANIYSSIFTTNASEAYVQCDKEGGTELWNMFTRIIILCLVFHFLGIVLPCHFFNYKLIKIVCNQSMTFLFLVNWQVVKNKNILCLLLLWSRSLVNSRGRIY